MGEVTCAGVGGQVASQLLALYDPTLPYHNAEHALRVTDAARGILADCHAEGVTVDGTVVLAATLGHDAGYRTDPATVGCRTREEYAAQLTAGVLLAAGWAAGRVDAVTAAILATHAAAAPSSTEEKVVRAADLAELAADYDRFAVNSELLSAEAELLSGSPISAAQWRNGAIRVLCGYLSEDIRITAAHDDADGVSRFHRAALANLHRYVQDLPA